MSVAVFYEPGLGFTEGLPPPQYDGAAIATGLRGEGIEATLASPDERPAAAVWVVPCDLPALIEPATAAGAQVVLTSVFVPFSPWHLKLTEEELAPLRDPWIADHCARQQRARSLRADAYADSIRAIAWAIEWLAQTKIETAATPATGLIYLGAVFNETSQPTIGRIHLLDGVEQVVLGRGRGAEVPILSGNVARAHLRFRGSSEAMEVTDLGGTNGTFLQHPNRQWEQLAAGQECPLLPGDELIVADGFRFRLLG